MAGNVNSTLADCLTGWDVPRDAAPRDGLPYLQPDCKIHPVRGASWDVSPKFLRAANLSGGGPPDFALDHAGFRIAKTLN